MKQATVFAALVLGSSQVIANVNLNTLEWMVINDSVMGGVSNSKVVVNGHSLTFVGNVSLANNGGFASFRAPHSFENMSLDSLRVKVQGDGKVYQLRLRVDGYYDGPAFVYRFKSEPGKEQVLNLSEQDFTLMFRGRRFESVYQFNFNDVRSIGFMISGKQAGEFELQVKQLQLSQKI